MLKKFLTHPLTRGLNIDDPRCTELRGTIIQKKIFLRQIYQEWYEAIVSHLPSGRGPVLELGSGGGFLSDYIPELITSEVFYCQNIRMVLDAFHLPYTDGALRSIVLTDVLHHLPEPEHFFSEAARCVRPHGRIIMIEPWVTRWSAFVYENLHHEPFHPESREWSFPRSGPLSGANGAMPWIIFERDRAKFEQKFPGWRITQIERMMPFRYLVSGGVSLRSLMPECSFVLWRKLENTLRPWMKDLAMFALIVLERD